MVAIVGRLRPWVEPCLGAEVTRRLGWDASHTSRAATHEAMAATMDAETEPWFATPGGALRVLVRRVCVDAQRPCVQNVRAHPRQTSPRCRRPDPSPNYLLGDTTESNKDPCDDVRRRETRLFRCLSSYDNCGRNPAQRMSCLSQTRVANICEPLTSKECADPNMFPIPEGLVMGPMGSQEGWEEQHFT